MIMHSKIQSMSFSEHLSISEIQRRSVISHNTIRWLKESDGAATQYRRTKAEDLLTPFEPVAEASNIELILVIFERFKQSAARDMYLNAVDVQIESLQMGAALEGAPVTETEGFILCGIYDVSPDKRKKMVNTRKKGFDAKEKAQAVWSSGSPHVVSTPPSVAKPQRESV